MEDLLMLLIFIFIITVFFLVFKNIKLKEKHLKKMKKLQEIITSLKQQQLLLNNKLFISNQYDSDYKKEVKAIAEEIVTLQKVFIELVSDRNIK